MGIGERVRFYRGARRLSQRELAKMLQMAPEQLNRYEKGRTAPKVATTVRMARALGVAVGDLLGD